MKYLLLIMVLITPISYSDWGDTYFCSATHHSQTNLDGEQTIHELQDYTFHLSKDKNAMVFEHTDHYFENTVIELQEVGSFPNLEAWSAGDADSKVVFLKGQFAHSFVSGRGVTVNIASCHKTN